MEGSYKTPIFADICEPIDFDEDNRGVKLIDVPLDFTFERLQRCFQNIGKIDHIHVQKNSGKTHGYILVYFEKQESAEKLLQSSLVKLESIAYKIQSATKSKTIIVHGEFNEGDADKLIFYCEQRFGQLTNISLSTDGFTCFLEFKKSREAADALENITKAMDRNVSVNAKWADVAMGRNSLLFLIKKPYGYYLSNEAIKFGIWVQLKHLSEPPLEELHMRIITAQTANMLGLSVEDVHLPHEEGRIPDYGYVVFPNLRGWYSADSCVDAALQCHPTGFKLNIEMPRIRPLINAENEPTYAESIAIQLCRNIRADRTIRLNRITAVVSPSYPLKMGQSGSERGGMRQQQMQMQMQMQQQQRQHSQSMSSSQGHRDSPFRSQAKGTRASKLTGASYAYLRSQLGKGLYWDLQVYLEKHLKAEVKGCLNGMLLLSLCIYSDCDREKALRLLHPALMKEINRKVREAEDGPNWESDADSASSTTEPNSSSSSSSLESTPQSASASATTPEESSVTLLQPPSASTLQTPQNTQTAQTAQEAAVMATPVMATPTQTQTQTPTSTETPGHATMQSEPAAPSADSATAISTPTQMTASSTETPTANADTETTSSSSSSSSSSSASMPPPTSPPPPETASSTTQTSTSAVFSNSPSILYASTYLSPSESFPPVDAFHEAILFETVLCLELEEIQPLSNILQPFLTHQTWLSDASASFSLQSDISIFPSSTQLYSQPEDIQINSAFNAIPFVLENTLEQPTSSSTSSRLPKMYPTPDATPEVRASPSAPAPGSFSAYISSVTTPQTANNTPSASSSTPSTSSSSSSASSWISSTSVSVPPPPAVPAPQFSSMPFTSTSSVALPPPPPLHSFLPPPPPPPHSAASSISVPAATSAGIFGTVPDPSSSSADSLSFTPSTTPSPSLSSFESALNSTSPSPSFPFATPARDVYHTQPASFPRQMHHQLPILRYPTSSADPSSMQQSRLQSNRQPLATPYLSSRPFGKSFDSSFSDMIKAVFVPSPVRRTRDGATKAPSLFKEVNMIEANLMNEYMNIAVYHPAIRLAYCAFILLPLLKGSFIYFNDDRTRLTNYGDRYGWVLKVTLISAVNAYTQLGEMCGRYLKRVSRTTSMQKMNSSAVPPVTEAMTFGAHLVLHHIVTACFDALHIHNPQADLLLSKAVQLFPSPVMFDRGASAMLQQRRVEEALRFLRRMKVIYPNHPYTVTLIGKVLIGADQRQCKMVYQMVYGIGDSKTGTGERKEGQQHQQQQNQQQNQHQQGSTPQGESQRRSAQTERPARQRVEQETDYTENVSAAADTKQPPNSFPTLACDSDTGAFNSTSSPSIPAPEFDFYSRPLVHMNPVLEAKRLFSFVAERTAIMWNSSKRVPASMKVAACTSLICLAELFAREGNHLMAVKVILGRDWLEKCTNAMMMTYPDEFSMGSTDIMNTSVFVTLPVPPTKLPPPAPVPPSVPANVPTSTPPASAARAGASSAAAGGAVSTPQTQTSGALSSNRQRMPAAPTQTPTQTTPTSTPRPSAASPSTPVNTAQAVREPSNPIRTQHNLLQPPVNPKARSSVLSNFYFDSSFDFDDDSDLFTTIDLFPSPLRKPLPFSKQPFVPLVDEIMFMIPSSLYLARILLVLGKSLVTIESRVTILSAYTCFDWSRSLNDKSMEAEKAIEAMNKMMSEIPFARVPVLPEKEVAERKQRIMAALGMGPKEKQMKIRRITAEEQEKISSANVGRALSELRAAPTARSTTPSARSTTNEQPRPAQNAERTQNADQDSEEEEETQEEDEDSNGMDYSSESGADEDDGEDEGDEDADEDSENQSEDE